MGDGRGPFEVRSPSLGGRGKRGPRSEAAHARAHTEFSTNVTISVTRVNTRGGVAGPRPTSRPAPPLVGRRYGRRRGGEKNHPPHKNHPSLTLEFNS